TSTLLTLLLVPCLYTLLEDTSLLMARAWKGRRGVAPAAVTLLLLLAALPLPRVADARSSGDEVLHEVHGAWQTAGAKRVSIRFPVGTLEIVAVDRATLSADVAVCSGREVGERTLKSARRVRLVATRVGDELRLRVEGWHFRFPGTTALEGKIEVPRELPLAVDMQVGDLSVCGVRRAARVELGVGELTFGGDPASIGSVDVDLGIGEGQLVEGGRNRQWAGVFGGGFHWDGKPGGAPVRIKLGVGEATVNMEDGAALEAVVPILRP
ncbi:MAG: hypothetical protein ABI960_08180, partial [Candidatus Eisenbacteria bacterium]